VSEWRVSVCGSVGVWGAGWVLAPGLGLLLTYTLPSRHSLTHSLAHSQLTTQQKGLLFYIQLQRSALSPSLVTAATRTSSASE
jgi:hypothetical protein